MQNIHNIAKEKGDLNKKQIMKVEALAASKANDNAEIATLKNELERVKSNCSKVCNELVEEKRNRLANIIALTHNINEMKTKNSIMQQDSIKNSIMQSPSCIISFQ